MSSFQGELVDRKPTLRISRRGLSILLLCVLSTPPLVVITLYWILPPAHEQPLSVAIELAQAEDDGAAGGMAVTLTNEGAERLDQLRVEINRAFHYLPREPLQPGQRIVMPVRWFAKKSGQRFEHPRWAIEKVWVSARLPNRSRAASSRDFTSEKSSDEALGESGHLDRR